MTESLWNKGMYSSSSFCLDGHFPSFQPDSVSSSSDALGVFESSHRDSVKILPERHYSSGDTGSSLMRSTQKEHGAPRESSAGHLSTKRYPAHGSSRHQDWSFNSGHQAKRARVENIIKGMSCTDVTANPHEEPDYTQEDETLQELTTHQTLLERGRSEDMSPTQQDEHLRQLRTRFCNTDESTDNKREEKSPSLNSSPGASTFDSFTDPCSEFDGSSARKYQGWKKVKLMDYFQSKPERIKLIADVLKYELSRAVSRSVDTIFKSMPLLPTSPNDSENSETLTPFQSSVCVENTLRYSCCGPADVHVPDVQTEALSLVVPKHEVEKASNFDPQSRSTDPHHPKSPISFNHDSALQRAPERRHSADGQCAPRASQEKCSEPGQSKLDMHWNAGKVKSKVNSRSVRSPHSHPVSLDPMLLESLCLPHMKMEPDSLMKNNLYMLNEGLTTNHLKKAKLMFFYTRYPSSLVLRTCFHDVQFTRCITSQLIKWFSNFREFYYIQMEKFARNAVVEGVVDVRHLTVNRESELFRALNMHYNKTNNFQVPVRFLEVAEITLREFYTAISMGKDRDPSWKKAIYKVICKLDSDVPAEFKTHHFS
ncbi:prospero homeobox protein 1-like [Cololabis saira]|uniref:prospero homeobox protein 1-like n=1 Tax=Cololabis saira TaxID=129043 RepID=UPI002AD2E509|nr:prospero homeobox protein 1-like [Cololabis saira]